MVKSSKICLLFHQLVENVVLLLEVLNVWDEGEDNVEWEEMSQVGVRILLAFMSQPQTEYCATASSKLTKLLKARKISSQGELCYIIGRLYQAFDASKQKGTLADSCRCSSTQAFCSVSEVNRV